MATCWYAFTRAALHAGDVFCMRGVPYGVRMVVGLPNPKNYVPGFDVAGRVEAVGKNVTRFQPGDEVFGACNGACAEYACAAEDSSAEAANLTFEQAAAVPLRRSQPPFTVFAMRGRCSQGRRS